MPSGTSRPSVPGVVDDRVRRDPVEPAAEGVVAEGAGTERSEPSLEGHGGDVLGRRPVRDASGDEAVDTGKVVVVELTERGAVRARPVHEGPFARRVHPAGAVVGSHLDPTMGWSGPGRHRPAVLPATGPRSALAVHRVDADQGIVTWTAAVWPRTTFLPCQNPTAWIR